jgi:hypothetical protein
MRSCRCRWFVKFIEYNIFDCLPFDWGLFCRRAHFSYSSSSRSYILNYSVSDLVYRIFISLMLLAIRFSLVFGASTICFLFSSSLPRLIWSAKFSKPDLFSLSYSITFYRSSKSPFSILFFYSILFKLSYNFLIVFCDSSYWRSLSTNFFCSWPFSSVNDFIWAFMEAVFSVDRLPYCP